MEAAATVDALINGLPATLSLTLDNKGAVEAARSAYNALTSTRQSMVTVLAVLEAVEAKIADLQAEAI
jgi:hypothetical protein